MAIIKACDSRHKIHNTLIVNISWYVKYNEKIRLIKANENIELDENKPCIIFLFLSHGGFSSKNKHTKAKNPYPKSP